MKKSILLFWLMVSAFAISAQQVHVTFHFRPSKFNFSKVYLAGSFENWSVPNAAYEMTDPDNDSVYTITTDLVPGTYEYKFVLIVNGNNEYYADPDNPVTVGQ